MFGWTPRDQESIYSTRKGIGVATVDVGKGSNLDSLRSQRGMAILISMDDLLWLLCLESVSQKLIQHRYTDENGWRPDTGQFWEFENGTARIRYPPLMLC
jgi:hypothetical protein